MALQILINQMGKPAGVPGVAREDLDLGTPVDLQALGGPFLAVQWSIGDKPIDYTVPAQSSAAYSAPNNALTQLTPIDYAGTYLIRVAVDQGFGLGARPEDNASITFYAGPALSPTFNLFPRRLPAFGERTEHNVPSPPFANNPRGWAEAIEKYFASLLNNTEEIFAFGRWDNGGATILDSKNIAGILNVAPGIFRVTFTNPAPSANYAVLPVLRNAAGFCVPYAETVNDFAIACSDPFLALTNYDFSFVVIKQ